MSGRFRASPSARMAARPVTVPPATRLHQLLQGVEALAGGDHVIHDEDALALHHGAVVAAQEQVLGPQGGDGPDGDVDGVGHVDLGPLPGDEVLLRPALAGHLVDEGDALGLGGEHVVIAAGGDALQQLLGAGHGELRVAEDHERADVEVV